MKLFRLVVNGCWFEIGVDLVLLGLVYLIAFT